MRSIPLVVVRPWGVPSSTRPAPASHNATTWAATSSGVPAMQNRSSGGGLAPSLDGRIETADHLEVGLDGCPRTFSGPGAVLVDDRHAADDELHHGVADPFAHDRQKFRIRAAAELHLVGDRARPTRRLPDPTSRSSEAPHPARADRRAWSRARGCNGCRRSRCRPRRAAHARSLRPRAGLQAASAPRGRADRARPPSPARGRHALPRRHRASRSGRRSRRGEA